MKLIVATRNKGKMEEIGRLFEGLDVSVSSLLDRPNVPDVVEDGDTFLGNALKKARAVAENTGLWTMADDSGLVVDALGGMPGVLSARYAGPGHDYVANNIKLMKEMEGVPDKERTARFVCLAVLASPDGRVWHAEGTCEGVIERGLRGSGGFGYDPLFLIPEIDKTMAELGMVEKNAISHRGRAFAKIREILVEILRDK